VPASVIAALIAAGGAIIVALITLYQHRDERRDKAEREDTQRKLEHGEALFGEYRHILDELRTELARSQTERDNWRKRAVNAERRVDEWLQGKEQ
jgi:uncharacterized membrane protein